MSSYEVTLWASAPYSCVLRQTDGHVDVVLYHDGRTLRLQSCDTEQTARALGYQWKRALARAEHERMLHG
jgi:hypothetical protein